MNEVYITPMDIEAQMVKILICVCTVDRPVMLRACLDSLLEQTKQTQNNIEIAVIDNHPQRKNRDQVREVSRFAPFPVHYIHEPHRGIPQARNAALDTGISLGADWIAFIDDDETASANWVAELYRAAYTHGYSAGDNLVPADVVAGPVNYAYPAGAGEWRCRSQRGDREKRDGQELDRAATNNVIFNLHLVRQKGLRFEDRLQFTGGEDTLFFQQLRKAGGRIVWSSKPIVSENVTWERITFKGHVSRAYRRGVALVETGVSLHGERQAKKQVFRAVKRGTMGVVKLLASPLTLLLGLGAALHMAMSGSRNVAEAAGIVAGLRGFSTHYYEKISGY
jgi:succinoglycan biosynthesis protein ExoM